MDHSPSWQGLPPDSGDRSALLIFFASIVCVCIALFGERVPLLWLGVPAGFTLVLFICLRLQHNGTGFSLDDNARELRLHGGRALSFDTIASFRLLLFRDRACLHVLTGALRRRRLIACVARPGPVQDILHALAERGFKVRVSKNPFRKRTAALLPLIIMPLLAIVLLYVYSDMLKSFPGMAIPARHLNIVPTSDCAQDARYYLEPFSLCLPDSYRLIEKKPQAALFYDRTTRTHIAIDSAPARRTVTHNPALQTVAAALGFGTVHKAAELAVRSRFGLMPLLLKSALLKHYDTATVQIYSLHAGQLNGIMLHGEQPWPQADSLEHMPEQVAEILLGRSDSGMTLRILISSGLRLSSEHLTGLIAGIH